MDARRAAWAESLLDFPAGHPYAKFDGAHWRLIELADLGVDVEPERVRPGVDRVLNWLADSPSARDLASLRVTERPRLHASQEGNAVYACTTLGFGDDPRVGTLVDVLLAAQWPDGGWNCDRHREAHRSSFHETVTPAIGLAVYARTFGRNDAFDAATRAAELLLDHRLFRAGGDGATIHPSWTVLHYPPYWHYDVLQGLRLLALLGLLDDDRATEALDVLRTARGHDGRFPGRSWASTDRPAAIDYGRGAANAMLNDRAREVLAASSSSA